AGVWRINVRVKKNPTAAPLLATVAVIADSDFHCSSRVDPAFLIRHQLLVEHRVTVGGKPATGGKSTATVTFPTTSIAELLKTHARKLAAMNISKTRLAKDNADLTLIKLGVLLSEQAAGGKDLFARETVRVPLVDTGSNGDKKSKDGRYTGLLNLAPL